MLGPKEKIVPMQAEIDPLSGIPRTAFLDFLDCTNISSLKALGKGGSNGYDELAEGL